MDYVECSASGRGMRDGNWFDDIETGSGIHRDSLPPHGIDRDDHPSQQAGVCSSWICSGPVLSLVASMPR